MMHKNLHITRAIPRSRSYLDRQIDTRRDGNTKYFRCRACILAGKPLFEELQRYPLYAHIKKFHPETQRDPANAAPPAEFFKLGAAAGSDQAIRPYQPHPSRQAETSLVFSHLDIHIGSETIGVRREYAHCETVEESFYCKICAKQPGGRHSKPSKVEIRAHIAAVHVQSDLVAPPEPNHPTRPRDEGVSRTTSKHRHKHKPIRRHSSPSGTPPDCTTSDRAESGTEASSLSLALQAYHLGRQSFKEQKMVKIKKSPRTPVADGTSTREERKGTRKHLRRQRNGDARKKLVVEVVLPAKTPPDVESDSESVIILTEEEFYAKAAQVLVEPVYLKRLLNRLRNTSKNKPLEYSAVNLYEPFIFRSRRDPAPQRIVPLTVEVKQSRLTSVWERVRSISRPLPVPIESDLDFARKYLEEEDLESLQEYSESSGIPLEQLMGYFQPDLIAAVEKDYADLERMEVYLRESLSDFPCEDDVVS